MQRINTRLTDLLDIQSPIIAPPMVGVSGVELAREVILAGGYGFVAPGFGDGPSFARQLDSIKSVLPGNSPDSLRIGAGFVGWMLDEGGNLADTLYVALEYKVKCIWLSFGNDLGKWVRYIREYDQQRKTPHNTLVWVVVNSVSEALHAVEKWKPDVLVVQGIEAGGHGQSETLPLLSLASLIQRSVPNLPPLVTAGGLVNGSQVASLLVLGAAGCVMGTRFAATTESMYSCKQKGALISANNSVRSHVFDEAMDLKFPAGINGRALFNKLFEDEAKGVSLEERRRLVKEAGEDDDISRRIVWAGASVALVKEIVGAAELFREIHQETVTHLNHQLLPPSKQLLVERV